MYLNPLAKEWTSFPSQSSVLARDFHKKLPGYDPTPLIPLPSLANEWGIKRVYVKYEGDRFELPSFKILGASWATFLALATRYSLPLESELSEVAAAISATSVALTLFAATDGNHGRAVARMAKMLGIPSKIFVPALMDETTRSLIAAEGATVIIVDGDYDATVLEAASKGDQADGVIIQDTAWPGYEQIPQWIVDGYTTLLAEIDEALGDQPTHIVCPVGVGSFAQAVVTHYKSPVTPSNTTVITVEPSAAPCLHTSLQKGRPTTVDTLHTICDGLNCGTVSSLAWPILSKGVECSTVVTDSQCHKAVEDLRIEGSIEAGPCGAAPLAALRRIIQEFEGRKTLGLGADSVVVLLCTEGKREYSLPSAS